MSDSLERIYRAVPRVDCKGLCHESCGPIDMSREEWRRLSLRGVVIPPPHVALTVLQRDGEYRCPALDENNRCSVYSDRPLICRQFGAVESMPCPHGCTVTPGLLMDAGARDLIRRVQKLDEAH